MLANKNNYKNRIIIYKILFLKNVAIIIKNNINNNKYTRYKYKYIYKYFNN